MAKNQRYTHGLHIGLTAPTGGVESGKPYRIGAFAGVALTTKAAGERFALWLDGSWDLEVSGALNEGDLVYINGSNGLTATATGNRPFGVAVTAKGTGVGVAEVALLGKLTSTAAAA